MRRLHFPYSNAGVANFGMNPHFDSSHIVDNLGSQLILESFPVVSSILDVSISVLRNEKYNGVLYSDFMFEHCSRVLST